MTLAEYLLRGCKKYFPLIKNRGTKKRDTGDRGATFLRKTHCPAVITEPFFGSCWEPDWTTFANSEHILSQALAHGIKNWADEHIL